MSRRLAILAQFDPDGGLPAHVLLHLEGLRPVVERLVLVSNSPLDGAARKQADHVVDRVIVRANSGWDFGGWRDALVSEDATVYDRVILTNSSVVGPLYPLAPIFDRMDAKAPDIWGMILTKNRGLHLQSYFLSASSRVVRSRPWRTFWDSVQDFDDKDEVITKYEVGFGRAMRAAGFDLVPLIPSPSFPKNIRMVNVNRLKGRVKIPFNVNYINRTVEFHEDLVRQGMPYLKASLLHGKDTYRFCGFDRLKAIPDLSFQFERLGG